MQKGIKTGANSLLEFVSQILYDPTAEMQKGIKTKHLIGVKHAVVCS